MDYSALPLPKINKVVQTKAMRDALRLRVDKSESDKVRERSGGICEAVWLHGSRKYRCPWTASEVHHMIPGRGSRARGPSLLADHKQHLCHNCHTLVTVKKLRRIGCEAPHWTDCYMRVK